MPFSDFLTTCWNYKKNLCFPRFDYLHKKQSGGAGQYGRVIGVAEVKYDI